MWKTGDKVFFVKNGIVDSQEKYDFQIGKIYKIVDVVKDGQEDYRDKNGYTYAVDKHGDGIVTWWIEPNSFELVRRPPTNEVEFLDAFQHNFKEGV